MISVDMSEAVKTFAQLRTPVDGVPMREALDLQKGQYGKAGMAMGLTGASAAAYSL
jgi:hypothetical protein